MKNTGCIMRKKYTLQLVALLAILLVFFCPGCNTISPKLQDEYIRPGLSEGMCSIFDEYRQRIPEIIAKDKVPGLSLALVDRDGILWAAGFGYTDYDCKTPVTTDTMFAICSISKTITATAVMIAVQDGLVELDVPIIEYWPQFTVKSRFEENPEKKITLRHLLNHTSGIAHEAPVGNIMKPSYGSLEEHVMSVSQTWLKYKVGQGYSYSGFGYDIVAYILQVQSGKSFAEYLEEKVFTPLNMTDCSVDSQFIRSHPNRAVGHMEHVKQMPQVGDIPYAGAGSVYANAKGMSRFVQFFLNEGKIDGQTVLEKSFIKKMYTPSIRSKDYGLGVHFNQLNGNYWLGHSGGGGGFVSAMYWLPEYGLGIIVLINSEECNTTLYILSDLIEKNLVEKNESFEIPSSEYQPWQLPDPDTFTPFKPEWKKYVGTYKYIMSGWKFDTVLNIALALGLTNEYLHVKVYEKDGYLFIDSIMMHEEGNARLNEHLSGLFFTPTGRCLDLQGPKFTWQNWEIKKIR